MFLRTSARGYRTFPGYPWVTKLQMHALLKDETAVTVEETVHCGTNRQCK